MADRALRPEVDALLGSAIRSIEELEVLVYLCKEQRQRSALEVAATLRLPEATAVTALQGLVLAKIIVQAGESSPLQYLCAPPDEDLRAALHELVQHYDENRFDLIMLISQRAIQRLRSGVLKMFSDSFRITGKKDG